MFRRLLKRHQRILGPVIDYAIALWAGSLFILVLLRALMLQTSFAAFPIHVEPRNWDSLYIRTLSLDSVDFSKYSSLVVRLNESEPGALAIIPDYQPEDFHVAQLSSSAQFSTGYFHYLDGKPIQKTPMTTASDPFTFRIQFNPTTFPHPKTKINLLVHPYMTFHLTNLDSIVKEIRLDSDDSAVGSL